MRYTQSQARVRAAEEAQSLLLQLASTPILSHTILNLNVEIPILPSIAPNSSPSVPLVIRRLSISNVVALSVYINAPSVSQEAFQVFLVPLKLFLHFLELFLVFLLQY
jgi:hypothetical protein